MFPPFPWGHWLYARVFADRCAGLSGDVVEAGVGLGGMSIFMALLVQQLGLDKTVYGVDTFEGLPEPNDRLDNPYFLAGTCGYRTDAGDEAGLATFFASAVDRGVHDRIAPVPGLFADALPELVEGRCFCFAHIDADLHDSVASALEHLYDHVEEGGIVAIDDFFHPAQGPCRAASEFFNSRGLRPVYHVVFPYSVFVVKGASTKTRPARSFDGNAYSLDWLRTDVFFLETLDRSLARSSGASLEECRLMLEVLRGAPRPSEIYDYWRALASFWKWIDTPPAQREAHTI